MLLAKSYSFCAFFVLFFSLPFCLYAQVISVKKDSVQTEVQSDSLSFRHLMKGAWTTPQIVVEAKTKEYTIEGNKALMLLDSVLQHHEQYYTRALQEDFEYTVRRYDNLTLCLSNFNLNNKFLNHFLPFFRKYLEKSVFSDRSVLPLSIRESIVDMGLNIKDDIKKELILYRNRLGIDQNIDDGTMTQSLDEMFPSINIFSSQIKLLNNRFASPLSPNAKNYYKYYITDTICVPKENKELIVLSFYPYSPENFVFRGSIHVNKKEHYRVERCEMEVPEHINLNFVNRIRIEIDYTKLNNGLVVPKMENMYTSFSLYHKLLMLYSVHNRTYDTYELGTNANRHVLDAPSSYIDLSGKDSAIVIGKLAKNVHLLSTNDGLKAFLDDMRKVPFYKFALEFTDIMTNGYIRTAHNPRKVYGGSKIDIGPVSSFLSTNAVEGQRVRLGARTTGYLSKHFFAEGFLAYGFRDKKWKYSGSLSLSIPKKRYYLNEFPKHDITVTKEFDLYTPGQIYSYYGKDNILYSLGSAYLTNRSYRELLKFRYRYDWLSGLSMRAELRQTEDIPTGTFSYLRIKPDSLLELVPKIKETKLGFHFRYAPGSKVYQGANKDPDKVRISKDIPIFDFSHEISMPIFGGEFKYHKSEFSLEHNFWISNLGNLDYKVTLGKIWNRVPYPMLNTPPANRSFEIHRFAFQMMEPLEYIADEYAYLFANYHMRGLLFNKIPWIKKLKIREVLIFNGMFGNISDVNSFENAPELFIIPAYVTPMHMQWYTECGFGLENIFRYLRFDIYRRITPSRVTPGRKWGLKFKFQLEF